MIQSAWKTYQSIKLKHGEHIIPVPSFAPYSRMIPMGLYLHRSHKQLNVGTILRPAGDSPDNKFPELDPTDALNRRSYDPLSVYVSKLRPAWDGMKEMHTYLVLPLSPIWLDPERYNPAYQPIPSELTRFKHPTNEELKENPQLDAFCCKKAIIVKQIN